MIVADDCDIRIVNFVREINILYVNTTKMTVCEINKVIAQGLIAQGIYLWYGADGIRADGVKDKIEKIEKILND